ncbi:vacuolar protein sorting-associated protein 53 homolog [Daktulosphaira vitifoliae]|uniref:vacuolar protein sorting-associated protein 53 homolog n=1 Tax=Daktulosphaira vitifoliae TaxID=58002 RepID=UPI0021AA8B08|nr:vacuolar protein sorting-associated protein 53 homolog [Daktulosphaira vitifoliae]
MNTNEEEAADMSNNNEALIYSMDVQKAIDEILPSDDPLDNPDFDTIDYINKLFPTEQSLVNIDDVINSLECKVDSIDNEIRSVIRGKIEVNKDGEAELEEAQRYIKHLSSQIKEIKQKAEHSDEIVKEITLDIKQLDCAKKNLTTSITTLNNLHMLVSGIETLRGLTTKRKYGEIVMPLQAVTVVMEHFKNYTDIPQIAQLATEVKKLQESLASQIMKDFHEALKGPNAKNFVPNRQMAEACKVVSILKPNVKDDLLNWFIDLQLSEYTHLFDTAEDVAWLDKVNQRYNWFKRQQMQCEEKFKEMFPDDWELSERLAVEFCIITKNELSKLMIKRKNEIDVKLLLYAIQKTVAFENLMSKIYNGNTILQHKDISKYNPVDDISQSFSNEMKISGDSKEITNMPIKNNDLQPSESPFHGLISDCFQPFLYVYIDSVDKNLSELIERFSNDVKIILVNDNIDDHTSVLPNCADLFLFYKKSLVQCTELSNHNPMLALATVFQKYLKEYALKILESNLPKISHPTTSLTTNVSNMTKDLIKDLQLLPSGITDPSGKNINSTPSELSRICCILTTADYCMETTQQLEEKLKEKIDSSLVEKISMANEQNIFQNIIFMCIKLLVQHLEADLEPALNSMVKISWQNISTVGDQSEYVSFITSHLKIVIPVVRSYLSSSRKYFTKFCITFANSFIPKFIQHLYKCKPMSNIGAEQLLLDTHSLKTILLDLPSINLEENRKAPASYTKVVVKGMTKAEMILKLVMAPTMKHYTSFVDQYLKLLPESDMSEFQKILEMKGLKAAERNELLNIFRPRNPTGSFVTSTAALSSLKQYTSRIKKNLISNSNN